MTFSAKVTDGAKSVADEQLMMADITAPKNIKHVLSIAIEKGGSTISDFMNTKGEQGYFQIDHQVYNREGQPCNKCGAEIKKIIIGQRSSFFCSACQR